MGAVWLNRCPFGTAPASRAGGFGWPLSGLTLFFTPSALAPPAGSPGSSGPALEGGIHSSSGPVFHFWTCHLGPCLNSVPAPPSPLYRRSLCRGLLRSGFLMSFVAAHSHASCSPFARFRRLLRIFELFVAALSHPFAHLPYCVPSAASRLMYRS